MPLGIRRLTRDRDGRLSTHLAMYPAAEAYEKLSELQRAELFYLGPNWAVRIGGTLHQYPDRDEAEFFYLSALDAELV